MLSTGAGGNVALLVGADGAVLIDDQFDQLAPKLRAAVALLTDKPVKFVINTHWHGDHTGANAVFGRNIASPHAHYLCWRTGTMDRWECAAFADWLRKSLV